MGAGWRSFKSRAWEFFKYGAPDWIRTSDQRFRKPLLYPTELQVLILMRARFYLSAPSSAILIDLVMLIDPKLWLIVPKLKSSIICSRRGKQRVRLV